MGGYLEVGLKLVAGCNRRHGQQEQHYAWGRVINTSRIEQCARPGHASPVCVGSGRATYLSGAGLSGGGRDVVGGLSGGGLEAGGGLQVEARSAEVS